MKIQGRPYYNTSQIEIKSKKLLTLFSPEYFKSIRPTPLLEITDFLKKQYGITFILDANLGFSLDNSRLLGACNPVKRVILIDAAVRQDEHKFNFTLAHEIGHLSLHREIKIIYEENDVNTNIETIYENPFSRKSLKTDFDWIEWQANSYASALLMPDDIFASKLAKVQNLMGSRVGKIYVDNQPCNQKTFYDIITSLSNFFHVSKSAVEYRLYGLKLVNDQRKNSLSDYLNPF